MAIEKGMINKTFNLQNIKINIEKYLQVEKIEIFVAREAGGENFRVEGKREEGK